MNKHAWTIARSRDSTHAEFGAWVFADLASTVKELIPSARDTRITLQDEDAILNATVPVGREDVAVDAVLEITTANECPPMDPWHEFLVGHCAHVQGWRVKPTVIFDATRALERGEQSDAPNVLVFVQRLDGTTPEHFDTNWYKHAGHADGAEAESEHSREERAREEAGHGGLYRQNRVLEAVTPTAWVVHGYTQLQLGMLIPAVPEEPYERTRGEEPFDRWPPRMVQGPEHRIL